MAARYKAKIETSDGLRTCFEARKHREGKPDLVARFGGIPLRQNRRAVIRDPAPAPAPYPRKELIRRLRKRECELCETGTTVAVHQVTGLKELGKPGPGQPAWAALMAKNAAQDAHRLRRHATSTSTQPPSRTRHKSLESSVRERCTLSLEGGCPEKARFIHVNPGPRWAAHPTRQAPLHRDQDGRPTQGQPSPPRTGRARCFEARRRTRGQEAPGSTIRRDTRSTAEGARSSPTPPRSRPTRRARS